MTTEEDIAGLRREVTAAQQRDARAAAGAEQAQARADALRADLQAEFGVATLDEARELLASLQAGVDDRTTSLRRLLQAAEGEQ